ncbi:hypothetical protein [Zobellella sp. DQSA1]|uniref:hypothetical protein n=1 Tax=Zobellella sp. DQSA1 TaxID=3342386 RepID=UPI0035BEC463
MAYSMGLPEQEKNFGVDEYFIGAPGHVEHRRYIYTGIFLNPIAIYGRKKLLYSCGRSYVHIYPHSLNEQRPV